jgi:hypothetical protein
VVAVLARLATATLVGVEVDIGCGLPAVTVVGLGDTAVLEARDRLRAAFGNAGFDWPTAASPSPCHRRTCPSRDPGSTVEYQFKPC